MNVRHVRFRRAVVAALLMTAIAPAGITAAASPAPSALPPQSHAFGDALDAWAAGWWQWALGQGAVSPVFDTDGELCQLGQTGKVWFLAGVFGQGTVHRQCAIPTGRAVFVPVVTNGYILFPWDPADTPELARVVNADAIDGVTGVEAEVDGTPVAVLEDRRVTSPDTVSPTTFPLLLDDENWLGLPPGDYEMAADGIYFLVPPLSPGRHTIHFQATFPGSEPIDVTYDLMVTSRPNG